MKFFSIVVHDCMDFGDRLKYHWKETFNEILFVHDCMDFGGRLKYQWKFVLANKDPKSNNLIFDSWSTSLYWSKKFVQVV